MKPIIYKEINLDLLSTEPERVRERRNQKLQNLTTLVQSGGIF